MIKQNKNNKQFPLHYTTRKPHLNPWSLNICPMHNILEYRTRVHKLKCVIGTSRRMKVARAKLTLLASRASFSSSNDELSWAARTSVRNCARLPLRVKVCEMIGAPCDTIASAVRRCPSNEYSLYGFTKPVGLRFGASLELRSPRSLPRRPRTNRERAQTSAASHWRAGRPRPAARAAR